MNSRELYELAKLMELREKGAKYDIPSGDSATTNLLTGPDGVLGQPGIEPDIISTRVKPRGLLSMLGASATNIENPVYAFLTGFTDDEDGSEPTGACDEPLEAGQVKTGYEGAVWGKVRRKTEVLELSDLGKINRGETTSLALVNDSMLTGDFATPESTMSQFSQNLRSEVAVRLMLVGVSFQNKLGRMVWNGDPTNNTSGGYAEFKGLNTLISDSKTDVITSASLPALASDVHDFNYANIYDNAQSLFWRITSMYRQAKHNAVTMGLDPVSLVLSMRTDMFNELTDLWPKVYANHSNRVTIGNTEYRNTTDAMLMTQLRDRMRNGRYLMIDGEEVPVVLDEYIPVKTDTTSANVSAGEFASDIYLLPMSVRGNFRTMYLEYFNFDGPNGANQAIQEGGLQGKAFTSDAGKFLWTTAHTSTCFAWEALIKPRLVLRTPQLAGRLQNVIYEPLQPVRSPDPDDPYFVNGGNTAAYSGFAPY